MTVRASTEYGSLVHDLATGSMFSEGLMRCGRRTSRVVPAEPGAPLCPKCYPRDERATAA